MDRALSDLHNHGRSGIPVEKEFGRKERWISKLTDRHFDRDFV